MLWTQIFSSCLCSSRLAVRGFALGARSVLRLLQQWCLSTLVTLSGIQAVPVDRSPGSTSLHSNSIVCLLMSGMWLPARPVLLHSSRSRAARLTSAQALLHSISSHVDSPWKLSTQTGHEFPWARLLSFMSILMADSFDCPAWLRKNGATQLDPQHSGYFPPPVPRAGYAPSTLLLLDKQCRSTQYECGHMKPLLRSKQWLTGILQSKLFWPGNVHSMTSLLFIKKILKKLVILH